MPTGAMQTPDNSHSFYKSFCGIAASQGTRVLDLAIQGERSGCGTLIVERIEWRRWRINKS
jgi:hypothetical protein